MYTYVWIIRAWDSKNPTAPSVTEQFTSLDDAVCYGALMHQHGFTIDLYEARKVEFTFDRIVMVKTNTDRIVGGDLDSAPV